MDRPLDAAKKDYRVGRYKEAMRKFQEVVKANPDDALAHHGLAASLVGLRRYDEAIKECYRALELNASLATPHAILANIYWQQRQHQKAENELRRALELEPDLAMAHITLGAIRLEQGKLREAESHLQQAANLQPEESVSYIGLGALFQRQRRHDDAIKAYQRAFELDPSFEARWRIVLAYVAKYKLYWLLVGLLVLVFVVRSLFTLPIMLIVEGFACATIVSAFQTGRRGLGGVLLLAAGMLLVLYVYHLLYGI
ncbi:MAG: tetratricopeptide repeat protein [Anaerolineae bacterium]|jgi:tetratricopeptide (TPR) repeat protein|nr:tetratricopeptide repeat protein [Anaerolineae bacterium]